MFSKRYALLTIASLYLWTSPIQASEPPLVEPSPLGDIKNRRDGAIVIGNENYHRLPQAVYAYNDASSMTQFMQNTRRISKYRMAYVQNGKEADLQKTLSKYYRRTSRKGTLWIYFAGHGYTDSEGNRYLLPIDADPNDLQSKGIEVNDIFEQTSQKGNRVVLIVDAGFGTTGRDGLPITDFKENTPYGIANNDPDQVLWLADDGTHNSPIYIQSQHSIFTYLLLGGIRGWADGELTGTADGTITMGELQQFVQDKMGQLGQPNHSTVFEHPDVTEWSIHSSPELASPPTEAKFEEMSIAIRMRNFANQSEAIKSEAQKVWNDVLYDVQKGGTQGEEALKRFVERFAESSVEMKWMVHIPEVLKAQRMLRDYENLGNIVAFDPKMCEDLGNLEADAMLGELSVEIIACLEAQLRLERLQSNKSHISTLLINNDLNKKNWKSWELRVRNHLKNIDRSQPDLTFSFAIFLYNKGSEYYKEALYWTDYTLDTRTQWPQGQNYMTKSNKLFQLRAQLALEIWMQAEKAYTKERTAELDQISRESRGLATNLAREWLDYARQAELPTDDAFNICLSTSIDPDFCKE
jgi:hypothetical protein